MPVFTSNVERPRIRNKASIRGRLTTNAGKILKLSLPFTCFLLLATVLSGCNVIGTINPAALQVTSTPEASVFLDGKHLGKTPFFTDQLDAKEYTLKIS